MNDYDGIYQKLREWYDDYYLAKSKKEKRRIEQNVRFYMNSIDDELYLELNENAGDGLFRHGFFEVDMENVLRKLDDKVNN